MIVGFRKLHIFWCCKGDISDTLWRSNKHFSCSILKPWHCLVSWHLQYVRFLGWHSGSVFSKVMSHKKVLTVNLTCSYILPLSSGRNPLRNKDRDLLCCSFLPPTHWHAGHLLTRSFCLSGGERGVTGSRTSHFSVTGWRSTVDKASLIFTLTSSLPPVALRPSITWETHVHC